MAEAISWWGSKGGKTCLPLVQGAVAAAAACSCHRRLWSAVGGCTCSLKMVAHGQGQEGQGDDTPRITVLGPLYGFSVAATLV